MRLLPRRRPGLPADVRRELSMLDGEHVIAVGSTPDGRQVVATSHALHLPGGEGYRRLGWERIVRASWKQGVLHVSEAGEPGSTPPVHHVPLADSGRLADAVHDRVTSTIVVSHHVRLAGRAGVRLIARRQPGSDELIWSMSFDRGVDPTDAAVRRQASKALDEYRQQTGL